MADVVYPGEEPLSNLGDVFKPKNHDVVLWKGDYFPLDVDFKNPDGSAMNLNGYTAQAQIRSTFASEIKYEFVTTVLAEDGLVQLMLPSSVSKTMIAGDYVWDFQVTDPSDNVRTYIAGDFKVIDEVTR